MRPRLGHFVHGANGSPADSGRLWRSTTQPTFVEASPRTQDDENGGPRGPAVFRPSFRRASYIGLPVWQSLQLTARMSPRSTGCWNSFLGTSNMTLPACCSPNTSWQMWQSLGMVFPAFDVC